MVSKIENTFDVPEVSGLSYNIYTDVNTCQEDWQKAAFQGQNLLHNTPFLNAVAHNFQNKMRQFYVVFYLNNQPVGRALFQCGLWEADASYNEEENQNASFSIKNWLAKKVRFNGILCGNILLTGEYGFNFDYERIEKSFVAKIITSAAKGIEKAFFKDSKYPTAIIAKDLETSPATDQDWKSLGYHFFAVQPNMLMDIDPEWTDFDDYLSRLSSKYRVRAKRAYKKSKDITFREFSKEDIENNLETIFNHFLSVQKNAGFNLVYLKPSYFLDLKRQMGDHYRLYGYYLNDQLIGFNTVILNHDELEAHFLGFDREVNISHQLYLTMLYDKIAKAIAFKKKKIVFARTALEIKSSVGATPKDLCIYLRHENSLLNKVVSPIINQLNPVEKWVQRHPFKDVSQV